jgi:hypothetical protein
MNTLLLLAVLHGVVSIPPIRVFQPYPHVKCPRGYATWWPSGKEFDNDKYAQCVKPIPQQSSKVIRDIRHTDNKTGKQGSSSHITDRP